MEDYDENEGGTNMLGIKIKMLRKENGFSQEELANKLHTTRSTISRYERNISVPTAADLVALSNIFDVSVEDLLSIEENQINTDDEDDLKKISRELSEINTRLFRRELLRNKLIFVIKIIAICLLVFFVITVVRFIYVNGC
ncbi:MAG: helix-turn-helix domain-containing protein [Saccharofermentans sp.]|nr:helix-turn-helix domain-containing protein [Saccharofermentans sp.]